MITKSIKKKLSKNKIKKNNLNKAKLLKTVDRIDEILLELKENAKRMHKRFKAFETKLQKLQKD